MVRSHTLDAVDGFGDPHWASRDYRTASEGVEFHCLSVENSLHTTVVSTYATVRAGFLSILAV